LALFGEKFSVFEHLDTCSYSIEERRDNRLRLAEDERLDQWIDNCGYTRIPADEL